MYMPEPPGGGSDFFASVTHGESVMRHIRLLDLCPSNSTPEGLQRFCFLSTGFPLPVCGQPPQAAGLAADAARSAASRLLSDSSEQAVCTVQAQA
jgi:hypothetical protein